MPRISGDDGEWRFPFRRDAPYYSELPVLAGSIYPAHAAEPLEDASEALENLDDLVKSVDSVGHSFGRIVQPRQYGFRWNGGEIGRDSNPSRMPRNSRSQDDRRDDDRDDD